MPTILRIGSYRFFFYSNENAEPAHIHVSRDRDVGKFWLDPLVELADSQGFARHELNEIRKLVEENREKFLEAWHEHFDDN
jgi:hypothetical protein